MVIFITTCSKTKNKNLVDGELMALGEMYVGPFHSQRIKFVKQFSEDFYYCTPSGPGVVKPDFMYYNYDAMTSVKKLKDPDFIQMHKERFDERYPGVRDEVDRIIYLGNQKYEGFLKSVFDIEEKGAEFHTVWSDKMTGGLGIQSHYMSLNINSNKSGCIPCKVQRAFRVGDTTFLNLNIIGGGGMLCAMDKDNNFIEGKVSDKVLSLLEDLNIDTKGLMQCHEDKKVREAYSMRNTTNIIRYMLREDVDPENIVKVDKSELKGIVMKYKQHIENFHPFLVENYPDKFMDEFDIVLG